MAKSWKAALGSKAAKPLAHLAALGPLAWLVWAAFADKLGANPAEYLVRATGDWTLRFLCLVLAVTPLRVTLAAPQLARFRRMLGLYAFLYGSCHFLSYAWFDMGFDLVDVAKDVAKRPFILVGVTAFSLMLPLAATSFNRAMKALGARRWQALHKAVYAVGCLAILHFFWMRAGKNNFAEVAVYAAIIGSLLAWRIVRKVSERRAKVAGDARAGSAPKIGD